MFYKIYPFKLYIGGSVGQGKETNPVDKMPKSKTVVLEFNICFQLLANEDP